MEVHHHSHTPRKKWSHYFWEFFMLFLAVTLGFFVENQREHMVEHRREKQYIRSMVVDLQADTTKLGNISRNHKVVAVGIDSILVNYDEFATGRYSRAFFQHMWSLDGFTDFIYTDRTIEQLKSSGNMRLIRKQAASDSIITYDDEARDFLIEQDGLQLIHNKLSDHLNEILNLRLVMKEFRKDPKALASNPSIDLLLTHDKVKIESFYNQLDLYRNALLAKSDVAEYLKKTATRLIAFLNDQYHLH